MLWFYLFSNGNQMLNQIKLKKRSGKWSLIKLLELFEMLTECEIFIIIQLGNISWIYLRRSSSIKNALDTSFIHYKNIHTLTHIWSIFKLFKTRLKVTETFILDNLMTGIRYKNLFEFHTLSCTKIHNFDIEFYIWWVNHILWIEDEFTWYNKLPLLMQKVVWTNFSN